MSMDANRVKQLNRALTAATRGLPQTRKMLRAFLGSPGGEVFLTAVVCAATALQDAECADEAYRLKCLYDKFKWDFR